MPNAIKASARAMRRVRRTFEELRGISGLSAENSWEVGQPADSDTASHSPSPREASGDPEPGARLCRRPAAALSNMPCATVGRGRPGLWGHHFEETASFLWPSPPVAISSEREGVNGARCESLPAKLVAKRKMRSNAQRRQALPPGGIERLPKEPALVSALFLTPRPSKSLSRNLEPCYCFASRFYQRTHHNQDEVILSCAQVIHRGQNA
jgi:hypothetical protein